MSTFKLLIKWLPVLIGMIPEIIELIERVKGELEKGVGSPTKEEVKVKAKEKIKEA